MANISENWFTGIIDLSHHQEQAIDWNALQEASIIAVIHKATEGRTFTDDRYHKRRQQAKDRGLLWGSYHFAGPADSDPVEQADHYLDFIGSTDGEFICFDCEKHGSYDNMLSFARHVHSRLNRYPAIYGRRLLRELMHGKEGSEVTRGVLWYDEYPPDPHIQPRQQLPDGWEDWTLWQYSDGAHGPTPRSPQQVGGDRNAFKGTAEELRQAWPFIRN
ncbi:glycoside hydrolase [Rhizobium sp. UPM1132]|uniref:glycoside hydrolase family 25 protein n=1 Tax=Rhizobium ruizarguesonis TaxID=2081791 RepID=UPI0014474A17|nr:glycoside hydrolase family 25 protein [Rhizobium ruizarguesonis]NKQ73452.1 glycoside hydrolase [Rhizobium ruizarguesonis]